MDSYDVIANQPIVIDNGSGVIKAGFAGDQVPKYIFSNFIGRPKHVRVMAGGLEGDVFHRAQSRRASRPAVHSLPNGARHCARSWDDMEKIWQYIYSKDQLNTYSEEHPVLLLTEAPLNPRNITGDIFFVRTLPKIAEKTGRDFFRKPSGVPGLFMSMQAVLSLYATAAPTGVVLDSGERRHPRCADSNEGFALQHAVHADRHCRPRCHSLSAAAAAQGGRLFFTPPLSWKLYAKSKERACYVSAKSMSRRRNLIRNGVTYSLPRWVSTGASNAGRIRRAPEL
uniref:Actin n=1 Tax=Macrostomum lignano TaxID=282301 RepID=A0A1I8JQB6_9PLAT